VTGDGTQVEPPPRAGQPAFPRDACFGRKILDGIEEQPLARLTSHDARRTGGSVKIGDAYRSAHDAAEPLQLDRGAQATQRKGS